MPQERHQPCDDLPDLASVATFDDRLRERATDPVVVMRAIARATALLDRAEGDEATKVRLSGYLGNAYRLIGRLADAAMHLESAIALASKRGDERAYLANLIRLGETRKFQERHGEAEQLFRAALDLSTNPAAPHLRVLEDFALQHLGKCLIEQGRGAEAVPLLVQALDIRRAKADESLIASTEAALRFARAS